MSMQSEDEMENDEAEDAEEFPDLGFIKFEGDAVSEGWFDARKSANALLGLDEALRHYITLQSQDLSAIDFDLPVRISKGSWIASIPTDAITIVKVCGGIVATTYLSAGVKKIAENDFKDVSTKQIFQKAFRALVWTAKIGKHLKGMRKKQFTKVKFVDGGNIIAIPNDANEYLEVPKEYLDMYVTANPRLLRRLTSPINPDLRLVVSAQDENADLIEEISYGDKTSFSDDDPPDDQDILFPELLHGERFDLNGELTRGNKNANTFGFKYKGHILSSQPLTGSIVSSKDLIFGECTMKGIVDRINSDGVVGAKRPKLLYSSLLPIRQT